MPDALVKSAQIKKNGEQLLNSLALYDLLAPFGSLYFTGSFSLDLMTWNDLDMQLVLKEPAQAKETLLHLVRHFFFDPRFIKAGLIEFQGDYKPSMPRGLYLGLKLNDPSYGGEWKLDLWIFSQEEVEKNQRFIQELQQVLTLELKLLVLELKCELMGAQGRVPQGSSYSIYQAILQGHRDRESILKHLHKGA